MFAGQAVRPWDRTDKGAGRGQGLGQGRVACEGCKSAALGGRDGVNRAGLDGGVRRWPLWKDYMFRRRVGRRRDGRVEPAVRVAPSRRDCRWATFDGWGPP